MTKKSVRGLIILCAIVLVIALALAAVILIPKLTDDSSDGTGSVCTISDITSLSFNCGDEMCTFELQDGTWVCTEYPDYPIGQNRLTRMASALQSVTASQSFAPDEDLSVYGLSPAAYTVTATGDNGSSLTLLIGSSCGDSDYYAMIDGSGEVSVIGNGLSYYLGYSLTDMIDAGSTPALTEDDITSLTVSYDGKTAVFNHEDDSWYYVNADGSTTAEEDISGTGSDGESHTARKYLNDLADELDGLETSTVAGYDCTAEELAAYGLDAPLSAVFTSVTDGETETDIYLIGSSVTADDGTVSWYVMVPGSEAVYLSTAGASLYELITALGA